MVPTAGRRDHRGIAEPARSNVDTQPSPGPPGSLGSGPWLYWAAGRRRHRHGAGRRGPCGQIRRAREGQLLGGVAGGLSARYGVDVTVVRVALVLSALASGFGAAAYVLAWLLLAAEGQSTTIAQRALADRRGLALAATLVAPLVVVLAVASALGAGFLGSLAWPTFVTAGGLVLIWRNGEPDERARLGQVLEPFAQVGWGSSPSRAWLAVRAAGGAVLLLAGLLAVLRGHPAARLAWPVAGALLVAASFVVFFGPWLLGLARDLVSERQARMLAEQRAEMAARVHDSVLQTLALVQRCADDPARIVALARAQERELRSWLFAGRVPGSFENGRVSSLAAAIQLMEAEVEAAHGVAVHAVTVGDCALGEQVRALLDAAREATLNAVRWSGAPSVSVFAEVEPGWVCLYVRDRGRGFDLATVGPDHRGIAESIRGRMARHGGTAEIQSAPGEGTEVRLRMPVERRR